MLQNKALIKSAKQSKTQTVKSQTIPEALLACAQAMHPDDFKRKQKTLNDILDNSPIESFFEIDQNYNSLIDNAQMLPGLHQKDINVIKFISLSLSTLLKQKMKEKGITENYFVQRIEEKRNHQVTLGAKKIRKAIVKCCNANNKIELEKNIELLGVCIDNHHAKCLMHINAQHCSHFDDALYLPYCQHYKMDKAFGEFISSKLFDLLIQKFKAKNISFKDFAEKILANTQVKGFMLLHQAIANDYLDVANKLIVLLKEPKCKDILHANLMNQTQEGLMLLPIAFKTGNPDSVLFAIRLLQTPGHENALKANLMNITEDDLISLQNVLDSSLSTNDHRINEIESFMYHSGYEQRKLDNPCVVQDDDCFVNECFGVNPNDHPLVNNALPLLFSGLSLQNTANKDRNGNGEAEIYLKLSECCKVIGENDFEIKRQALVRCIDDNETSFLLKIDAKKRTIVDRVLYFPFKHQQSKNKNFAEFISLSLFDLIYEKMRSRNIPFMQFAQTILANVSSNGFMPLHSALKTGSTKIASRIFALLQTPHFENILIANLSSITYGGFTSLAQAVMSKNLDNIKEIIRLCEQNLRLDQWQKILLNHSNNDYNILHDAANTGDITIFMYVVGALQAAFAEDAHNVITKLANVKTKNTNCLPKGYENGAIEKFLSNYRCHLSPTSATFKM